MFSSWIPVEDRLFPNILVDKPFPLHTLGVEILGGCLCTTSNCFTLIFQFLVVVVLLAVPRQVNALRAIFKETLGGKHHLARRVAAGSFFPQKMRRSHHSDICKCMSMYISIQDIG